MPRRTNAGIHTVRNDRDRSSGDRTRAYLAGAARCWTQAQAQGLEWWAPSHQAFSALRALAQAATGHESLDGLHSRDAKEEVNAG